MESTRTASQRLDNLREIVVPTLRPYATKISVFGSFARMEENADSDIDLLVTLRSRDERPPLGLQWVRLAQELSAALGRDVDLISDAVLRSELQSQVAEDEIVLYDEG